MATRPTEYPRWAELANGTPAANITDPPSGNKDTGWTTDQVPPSSWFNWFMQNAYDWVKYLDGLGSFLASPWSKRVAGGATNWQSVVFAPNLGEAGRLVIQSNSHYYYSDDLGLTWTQGSASGATTMDIGFDPNATAGKRFVAVGPTNKVDVSSDGITWTAKTGPSVGNDLSTISVHHGGDIWACGISNGKVGISLDNGFTWSEKTTGLASGITGVQFSSTGNELVAMTSGGGTTTSIATSTNSGVAWTLRTSPSGMNPNPGAATFSGSNVFWGWSTTASKTLYTSPDGTTWTLAFTSTTSTYLAGTVTGKNWVWTGKDVAIFPCTTANGPVVITNDGATWRQVANPILTQAGATTGTLVCSLYKPSAVAGNPAGYPGGACLIDAAGLPYVSILSAPVNS